MAKTAGASQREAGRDVCDDGISRQRVAGLQTSRSGPYQYRYEARLDRNAGLRYACSIWGRQKPRYGYRRLWAVLARQGWVNVTRIYRLYRQEGLMVLRLNEPV